MRTVWCGTPLSKKSTTKDSRNAARRCLVFRGSGRLAIFLRILHLTTLGASTEEHGLSQCKSRQDKHRLHWGDESRPMPTPSSKPKQPQTLGPSIIQGSKACLEETAISPKKSPLDFARNERKCLASPTSCNRLDQQQQVNHNTTSRSISQYVIDCSVEW